MGMNSACLQQGCFALQETAALHARAWNHARSRCIQASQQAMQLGTGRHADLESRFSSLRAEGAGRTVGLGACDERRYMEVSAIRSEGHRCQTRVAE
jgi:hypothetical protein